MGAAVEPQVCVTVTQTVIDTAGDLGIVDTAALLRQVNLDRDILGRPENRIAFSQHEQLWSACTQASPTFGLAFGRRCRFPSFGVVGYLSMNCATIGAALQICATYQGLVGQGGDVSYHRDGGQLQLRYCPINAGKPVTARRVEGILAAQFSMGRQLAGPAFQPTAVCFSHAAAAKPQLYEGFFGCPVHFNHAFDGLVFRPEIESLAIPLASREIFALIKSQADRQVGALQRHSDIAATVGGFIEETLLAGRLVDKDQIARRLGISTRTLQRHLAGEGSSWQAVLDNTRHRLALALLEAPAHSVTDIGAMLGFAEPSAFYRAFRKWQGVTPGQYRRRHHCDNP